MDLYQSNNRRVHMSKSNKLGLILGGILTAAIAAPAPAADPSQGQMSPEMQEMMAKAEKLGKPGEQHKVLDNFAGKWTYTTKGWMKPGDPPMESKGTADHEWILE